MTETPNYSKRAATLRAEYGGVVTKIFKLLDDLNVLEQLRKSTPPRQRYLFDRLENEMRKREKIAAEINEADVLSFLEPDEE